MGGNSLKDKVVVVTGASSGFGEAAALAFARDGCRVVLAARRVERLEQVASQVRAAGGEALVVPLDVTQPANIEALAEVVITTFGRVDVLFNNAGFGRLNWLENLDPEVDIITQLDVNLKGAILVVRAFLPHMLRQRGGVIINMASMMSWIASPMYSVYAASKYGLRGFTEALRREVKPFGIQVCGIYPAGAATEFSQHAGDSALKRDIKTPDWMNMSAEYVAGKVVGLARHPRRVLVMPWYMNAARWMDAHFHWLVDAVMGIVVKKYHHPRD